DAVSILQAPNNMEKLPLETLTAICEYMADDTRTLKALRRTTSYLADAAARVLFKHLVVENSEDSWENYFAVSSHPVFARHIRTLEMPKTGDHASFENRNISGFALASWRNDGEMFEAPPALTTLMLGGCQHLYGRQRLRGGVVRWENIRKLRLDMSLLWDEHAQEVLKSLDREFRGGSVPGQWLSKLTGLRKLRLTQQPCFWAEGNADVFLDPVWPFLSAGVSGLESLYLYHAAVRMEDLKNFLRNQSTTLTSLIISQPHMHRSDLRELTRQIPQLVPNVNAGYCKPPSTQDDEDLNESEWMRPRKTGHMLMIRFGDASDYDY
ncbi:MAG: hypothetical protein Q9174_004455, partial [Haloplaca sp. 1 TL-2023]